jgi:hypothetical protein
MKNLLYYIIIGTLFTSCCNKPELLSNGLTKSVSEINEYIVNLENESSIADTITHTYKKYNENDKLIKRISYMLFDSGQMEIDYFYDSNNKIQKEIVTMSDTTKFTVSYFYKDSLRYQSKAINENETEKFVGVETHFYNDDGIREKSTSSQIFVDLISNDTITNSINTTYYNSDELIESTETFHKGKSDRNQKRKYEYDCLTLTKQKVYNQNDSLISTITYEYKLDEFENWIEKKIITDGIAKQKIVRNLKYK